MEKKQKTKPGLSACPSEGDRLQMGRADSAVLGALQPV